MRSTSALIAQAAELGCQVHGGQNRRGCPLTGLAEAERVVAACTALERQVLALKYGGVELRHELAADGSTVIGVVAVKWATDRQVAELMGVRQRQVASSLRSARRKVAAALE